MNKKKINGREEQRVFKSGTHYRLSSDFRTGAGAVIPKGAVIIYESRHMAPGSECHCVRLVSPSAGGPETLLVLSDFIGSY